MAGARLRVLSQGKSQGPGAVRETERNRRAGRPRSLLLDDEATAGSIAEALAGVVARTGKEATLIFYFAGHGVRDDDGKIIFTSSDTRLDRLDRTGLEMGKRRQLRRLGRQLGRMCGGGAAPLLNDQLDHVLADKAVRGLVERPPHQVSD